MTKNKSFNNIKTYIIAAIAGLIVLVCFMYFTKMRIGFQEKNEAHARLQDKIYGIQAVEYVNPAVKDCVLSLYLTADKRLSNGDKTYKNLEDNADAIYAAYTLGLQEGSGSWKKKKIYV